MLSEIHLLLGLALGLGMLHALDADHIIAVSVISADKHGGLRSTRYAVMWAGGHGIALLIISLLFYQLGEWWPLLMSAVAEQLVGLTLIGLGLLLAYRIKKSSLTISVHHHDGMRPHLHWHAPDGQEKQSSTKHSHKAALIGGLHGMAGSAPLLVSLPLVQRSQLSELLLYVVIFSLGVFISMLSFGGVLGHGLKKLQLRSLKIYRYFLIAMSVASIGIGVRLVSG